MGAVPDEGDRGGEKETIFHIFLILEKFPSDFFKARMLVVKARFTLI